MNPAVVNHKMESPAVATTRWNSISGADVGIDTLDRSQPTIDELLHWAGVTAAVQTLSST